MGSDKASLAPRPASMKRVPVGSVVRYRIKIFSYTGILKRNPTKTEDAYSVWFIHLGYTIHMAEHIWTKFELVDDLAEIMRAKEAYKNKKIERRLEDDFLATLGIGDPDGDV